MAESHEFHYPDDPPLECDLIMKGGVTSGVIYPLAVCELAQHYRFRAVGGTSAGAIAASVTAAAEYGRRTGGFAVVANLPRWVPARSVTGKSNLFELFQPDPDTARLFGLVTAGIGGKRVWHFARVLLGYWVGAVLGGILGLVLLVAVLATSSGTALIAGSIASVILLLSGSAIGVLAAIARDVLVKVSGNGFGMCSGMPNGRSNAAALTPWLHEQIQTAAGRSITDSPVTFGDLWQGPDGTGTRVDKAIDLAIMTTNLSEGRPQNMPWDRGRVYFDPDEMYALFPRDIVDWMIAHPRALPVDRIKRARTEGERAEALPKVPWPSADNVPVVVATRMSLSLPVLLSGVRLYKYVRVDQRKQALALKPLWFTDGGICSNFPVHYFDGPLPSRPTFAIDLVTFPDPDEQPDADESKNVVLPNGSREGYDWTWSNVEGLPGFLKSIVDTARTWVDKSALTMPGYRDRIVTVFHSTSEGGTNLDMKQEVIDALADRGFQAARTLEQRFTVSSGGTAPIGWVEHRWARYRTTMAAFEEWLALYHKAFRQPDSPCEAGYRTLLDPDVDNPDKPFRFSSWSDRLEALARTDALDALAEQWAETECEEDDESRNFSFLDNSPFPRPSLRAHRTL